MKDGEIDDILKQAAAAKPDVDPALLDRVSKSIGSSLRPVRPMPPSWILAGGLVLIGASVALAGAMLLGPHGIQKMSALDIGLIFPSLGSLMLLASTLCVAEALPGSRRPVIPWVLGVCGCLELLGVFDLLFHDYRTERFVSQGVACLTAGLALAIPASVGTWWVLRRGFAVNSLAAGFAQGMLAGLAGVTMLELHCPNFEALHVMVWHVAVLPVSGAVGMLVARTARERGRRLAAWG